MTDSRNLEAAGNAELAPCCPARVHTLSCALSSSPLGAPVAIDESLYLVRIPLPHNPLKYVNSYFVLEPHRTTVIDVGFNLPECEAALTGALASLGRSWDEVQVVLTHSHPDHTGNLDRIWKPGMQVAGNIHSFIEVCNRQALDAVVFGPAVVRASTAEQRGDLEMRNSALHLPVSAELLPLRRDIPFRFLAEGDTLELGGRRFEVVETPGHDPWHICLYDRSHRLMIVGDHVLEHITPSVTSWNLSNDALSDFLCSLEKMKRYEVDLVLPAHGDPYCGLSERSDALIAHHRKRLGQIYNLVEEGNRDIVSISEAFPWRYPNWSRWPLDQKFSSMGETMAHLIHLVRNGELSVEVRQDEYLFSAAH
ncbi:MBL fold metallo-hydrolase [Adlercreutzia aquisgranensis]|uniref:MBL fold metallo-hydrolase n=1 Tax=Adlercreutzia aquisgranensis TaxID=2941323 RepID=UPI00203D73A1|nr:MBL fold metallo-hydrolase [Adlercreutzia aquisgranensis]